MKVSEVIGAIKNQHRGMIYRTLIIKGNQFDYSIDTDCLWINGVRIIVHEHDEQFINAIKRTISLRKFAALDLFSAVQEIMNYIAIRKTKLWKEIYD